MSDTELTTRQAEKWLAAMRNIRHDNADMFGNGDLSIVEHYLISARAAVDTGLIEMDIDQTRLGEVVAAGRKIWDAYNDAMKIDPN